MWNHIRKWWAAEGALVGLQGVSDRMLADMGLERDGLRQRVMGAASPSEARRPSGKITLADPGRC